MKMTFVADKIYYNFSQENSKITNMSNTFTDVRGTLNRNTAFSQSKLTFSKCYFVNLIDI